jgi:hypothetical protein
VRNELKQQPDEEPFKSALESLDHLPWNGSIPLTIGGDPVETLSSYLLPKWLSSRHIDQLLRLISIRLDSQWIECDLPYAEVFQDMLSIYRSRKHAYRTLKETDGRKALGYKMAVEQKPAAFIINVMVSTDDVTIPFGDCSGNHWIAVIVDTQHNSLWYYDSYHRSIPQPIFDLFSWWLEQHGYRSKPKVVPLDGPLQTDNHSCGVLAANVILHHFIPSTPLMNADTMYAQRVRIYVEMVRLMNEKVSEYIDIYMQWLT